MHEFSLAEKILECALDLSRAHDDAPVERVVVEIGALQAVVPESLIFAFTAAARDTAAEGAELEWQEIPARVECPACAATYTPADIMWVCPSCGAAGGHALCGDELVITRVVLSDAVQSQASSMDA